MDGMDDPDERDLRRRRLAKRMVAHRARTQTIYAFTGFTRHRLETLRHRWGVSAQERRRGPSPTSYAEFFRTSRAIQVATAAALLCQFLGIGAKAEAPSSRSMTLETGEQLCYVYEALQASFPDLDLEFEHLVLLASGLTAGTVLQLGCCSQCGAAILIDRLAARTAMCKPSCHSL